MLCLWTVAAALLILSEAGQQTATMKSLRNKCQLEYVANKNESLVIDDGQLYVLPLENQKNIAFIYYCEAGGGAYQSTFWGCIYTTDNHRRIYIANGRSAYVSSDTICECKGAKGSIAAIDCNKTS